MFLERVIMRIWNRRCWWLWIDLPPEELFGGEVSAALEVDSLHNVIVFGYALNPAPEVPPFEVVLRTQSLHTSLQVSPFLNRKCLSNSVDELQFRVDVYHVHLFKPNIHYLFVNKTPLL